MSKECSSGCRKYLDRRLKQDAGCIDRYGNDRSFRHALLQEHTLLLQEHTRNSLIVHVVVFTRVHRQHIDLQPHKDTCANNMRLLCPILLALMMVYVDMLN